MTRHHHSHSTHGMKGLGGLKNKIPKAHGETHGLARIKAVKKLVIGGKGHHKHSFGLHVHLRHGGH